MAQAVISEFAQLPSLRPTQKSRNCKIMQTNIDQEGGFQKNRWFAITLGKRITEGG